MTKEEYQLILKKGLNIFNGQLKEFNVWMNTPNFVLGTRPINSTFKEVDNMLNKFKVLV